MMTENICTFLFSDQAQQLNFKKIILCIFEAASAREQLTHSDDLLFYIYTLWFKHIFHPFALIPLAFLPLHHFNSPPVVCICFLIPQVSNYPVRCGYKTILHTSQEKRKISPT